MAENSARESSSPQLFTVRQFCERHAWATEGGIRHLIFNARKNGFQDCIRRVGRRVLIHEERFFDWVESKNSTKG